MVILTIFVSVSPKVYTQIESTKHQIAKDLKQVPKKTGVSILPTNVLVGIKQDSNLNGRRFNIYTYYLVSGESTVAEIQKAAVSTKMCEYLLEALRKSGVTTPEIGVFIDEFEHSA